MVELMEQVGTATEAAEMVEEYVRNGMSRDIERLNIIINSLADVLYETLGEDEDAYEDALNKIMGDKERADLGI